MKRGYGIREVLACRDEIVRILNEGHTISYVYRELFSRGQITIKYSHFHNLLKRMNIRPRAIKRISFDIEYPPKQYDIFSNKNKEKISNDNTKPSNFDIVDEDDLL